MKTPSKKKYTTKSGLNINLKYNSGESDRGLDGYWQLHKLSATINGREIGYIKVSYVPRDRVPNIFEYSSILGQHSIKRAYNSGDEKKLAMEISRYHDMSLVNDLYYWENGTWKYEWSNHPPPPEDMDNWWKESIIKMKNLYVENTKKKYSDFVRYWVDKPLVDFINVEKEFQRKGVGVVLYLSAAKWMGINGMKLYASGLQSPSAKSSWEYLKSHYDVKSENITYNGKKIKRFYLDFVTNKS